jgi:PKD repeat protein
MKKVFLQISFLLISIFSFTELLAQEWVQMMQDPNRNFYTTLNEFNNYWANRPMEKGKGYKAFRRWEAYMAPRVYPSGDVTLPSQTYDNYVEWLNANPGNSNQNSISGSWTLLGPIGKPNGGGAGRINFLRFDPNNTNIMYVGAPDGGLWKTTNGGASWSTNTDLLSVIGCSDIAIDPTNTQTMYLATGDGDAGDSYSMGVFKSTDGGLTWNSLPNLSWTRNQARTISRLLINPTNPLIIMAFGSSGIWRTTDGGSTWSQPTGTFNGIKDAEFKPGDPNTVYAAGTVFKKSTDGGLTWTTITTGLTGIGRMAIAVTPANNTYVYVLAAKSSDNGFLALIRSTNSGTSFTTRMASTTTNNILGWDNGADAGGQGWYDLAIAASPTNAEEIYTGGVNIWKSTNGGTSFTLNAHWFGGYSKPYVHADIHDLIFLPGSGTTVFSGCDGGVFKTSNSGTAWSDISANLAIAQQYRIGLSASNANLLVSGHQDNGTNKYNNGPWSQIYGGDGMEAFIDRTNDNIIYASYVYGEYVKSTNGGTSFAAITTGIPFGTGTQDWLCAWHQDPVTANTIYAGGRAALYRTTNGGTSWSALGTPTGTGNITDFVICPSNNTIIYSIKSGTNAVSKSTNSGTNWTAVSTGLPTGVAPTSITVSNTDPNLVFVTYSGYGATNKVYKSSNGGTSWTNLSSGLPNIPVNTIVYQNNSANRGIYIGTDVGVYYMDDTTPWISFNNGLPNVAIRDLEIYYPTGRLRAATYGRGTWDSDLYSAVPSVPIANYNADRIVICEGQSVNFTNSSLNLPTSYTWSFAGGTPSTSTVTNPTITYSTAGIYSVTLTATNTQGSDDEIRIGYVTVLSASGGPLPISEGFVTATFAPTGWTLVNPDAGTTWVRSATVGNTPTSGNSMFFDNYNFDDRGNNDELRTPHLNFTGLSSAKMTFDVAHAPYDATLVDGLEVLISTDCELNWTSLYSKSYTTLATAAATTAAFVPTATQWRTDTVNLTPYINQQNVTLAIRNLAGYGNNIYVDNINISGVTVGVAPTASFTVNAANICPGNSVTFTNTSTGSPTSYSWNFAGGTPASSTAASPTISYTNAGVYAVTLTATNAFGSDPEIRINYITVTSNPGVTSLVTNVDCNGGANGQINLTPSGGTAPYSFNWTGGVTTEDRSALTAGIYTVTISDANGCTTSNNITITQPANVVSSTVSTNNVTCFGASNGNINLTLSGGTAPYTFNWTGGVTTEDRTGLSAGVYTVTIRDANNCSITNSATITQPSSAVSSTAISSNVSCNGGADGIVNLTPTGGSAPYTFIWTGGITTEDRSGLSAGVYTVTIRDANNCSVTNSATVTQPSNALSSSIVAVNNATCQLPGSIDINVSGGTAGYTYLWSNTSTSQDINGLSAGSYSVTVTDANACVVYLGPIPITSASAPFANLSAVNNVSCNGLSNGAINITVSGANPGFSYLWSNASTTEDISGLSAGTYSVTVTDNLGCVANVNGINITSPTALTSSSTTIDASCNGQNNGSINLTVNDGTAPYSFNWENGSTTEDRNGLAAGSYNVTIIDANACSIFSNAVINQPTAISIIPNSVINASCNGQNSASIDISVNGGTAPYSFNWNNTSTSEDLIGISAGTYTVTVIDGLGCNVSSSNFVITEPNAISITILNNGLLCNGANDGSINVTVSGGTAGYNYLWSDGNFSEDISGLSAGNYVVTVTDNNACTAVSSIQISEPAAIVVNFSSSPQTCIPNSGTAQVTASGGTGSLNFLWSNGANSANIGGLNAGLYTVTVTDANACSAISSVSVGNSCTSCALSANASLVDVSCTGGNDGSATVIAVGGTAPFTYLWDNGVTLATNNGLGAAVYNVTITDANACSATAFVTIGQPNSALTSSVDSIVNNSGTNDGSINISVNGGTPGYSFNWSNGASTEDISGLADGTYDLTVTDANGCASTLSVSLVLSGMAILDNVHNFTLLPNPNDGNFSIDIQLNQAESHTVHLVDVLGRTLYQWNLNQIINHIPVNMSNLSAGVYFVVLKNGKEIQHSKKLVISK